MKTYQQSLDEIRACKREAQQGIEDAELEINLDAQCDHIQELVDRDKGEKVVYIFDDYEAWIKCPNCREEIELLRNFCPECGKRLVW